MKRFRPFICFTFIIVIFITLTSCTPAVVFTEVTTPSVTASAAVTLPAQVRVKGAAWVADNILAYYAEDGVHIRDVENGDGASFVVSDTFNTDKTSSFSLSPNGEKIAVTIVDNHGNYSYGVYRANTGELIRYVEPDEKFGQQYGMDDYRKGFLDNETLYFYNSAGIWLFKLSTGEQKQITPDPTAYYEALNKEQRDYFEWICSPVVLSGKLYYSGIRNTDNISHLYCTDQNGETEIDIDGNTGMLAAVPDRGFLYETKINDDRQTWFYDIKTGISDFLFGNVLSEPVINGIEIGYIEKGTQENDFTAMLYNIDTKQTQSFPIYQAARDFPQEDRHQFGHFAGFISNNQGYVFLFSVGHRSKTESRIANTFMSYDTRTEKVKSIIENENNVSDGLEISPSGKYLWLRNEIVTGNGYEIRVIGMDDFLLSDMNN